MKKPPELFLWILVVGILLWPMGYALTADLLAGFWQEVASGMIGTAAALIGGIPMALYIDRVIKHREEEKRAKENLVSERNLLRLIKEELEVCQSMIEERNANPATLPIQPLKSDLWHALSNSGKLQLISNHSLLNDIASMYYLVDLVRNIEAMAYRAARSATVSFGGGKTATQLLFEDARRFDNLLSTSFEEVFSGINAHLLN